MNSPITHEPNCDSNVWEHTHKILKHVPVCFAVDVRQEMLEEAQTKLTNLLNSTEGKVDKWVQNTSALETYFIYICRTKYFQKGVPVKYHLTWLTPHRVLMKNLYLGYFHSPRNKRSEVMRLMGNVLGLDRDEVSEVGQRSLL